jgi:hypothetical protein
MATAYLESLRAIVLAMMHALAGPSLPADAPIIGDAIVLAVLHEEKPALSSSNEDLAAMVSTAWRESLFRINPKPYREEWAHQWCGAFQLTCATMPKSLTDQARKALSIIRLGTEQCPQAPLARYLGGCMTGAARREGDTRLTMAREILPIADVSQVE